MAQIDNVRADPIFDPQSRYPGSDDLPLVGRPSTLDAPAATNLHARLMNGFLYERRRQSGNRYQMALDHDYYDSIQLTDEDIAELTERGQPLYVYNLVKRAADWVIGTEKRTRIDFKVLARNKNRDAVQGARNKTDLLKYLSDVNKEPWHRSQAFREAVISGLGWMENGVRADPDEEPIYSRKESWRNILHDSHALELDGSDMMYLYRYKWTDVEVAQAMFPGRQSQIAQAVVGAVQADDADEDEYYLGNRVSGQDYLVGQAGRYPTASFNGFLDNSRDRVKLIECWYRKPVQDKIVLAKELPMFHGLRYDAKNDDMRHAVLAGDASIVERVNMAVFYCLMTEGHLLAMGRSPYRHNQFPFTPIWCYRRGRDNAPYGMIRPIRDPQDGFNARMRKALFALSAYKVEATSDAVDPKTQSWEDVRTEAGRPDAMLIRKPGTSLEVTQDRQLAEGHMKLAEMDAGLILDSSGVTADNLGMESNAQSGKAIIAKQSEGSAVTAEIFDNLRLANQIHGEKELSLAEQYITDEREIRVTDSRGRPTWKKVNEVIVNPDGSTRILNDITATKSDFVIDQADFNVSLRQAASQQLFDFAGKIATSADPMLVLQIIDMAVDQSNLPDKDELVKRIRAITGYQSPEDALTPEEQEEQRVAKEQADAQAQEQAEQQKAAIDADLQNKLADAEKKRAEAQKILAEAEKQKLEAAQLVSESGQQDVVQQAIAEVQAKAQAQIDGLTETIADLQAEQRNREAEHAARLEAEKYKADQAREAAMHTANRTHEATVRAAELQHGPKAALPEHHEAMADVMQSVHELAESMKALEKEIAEGKKSGAEESKKLVEHVEKVVEKAVAAAEKAEKPAEAKPAAPTEIHIGPINIDAKSAAGGKTITISPDGKSATIKPDKPEKKD